jgi:hypothetical protein
VESVPDGGMPISMDDLFAAIGELYVQVRVMRKLLEAKQAPIDNNNIRREESGIRSAS